MLSLIIGIFYFLNLNSIINNFLIMGIVISKFSNTYGLLYFHKSNPFEIYGTAGTYIFSLLLSIQLFFFGLINH
jgi:hypothetical protein